MSAATFYAWKARFGGLDVSDARRLKALEDENVKLKKLLAMQCSTLGASTTTTTVRTRSSAGSGHPATRAAGAKKR
jgi:hypothetical protein